ncbi:hypothetical protein O6H91_12G091900 [Diphasiastrum complanatum]|uniref:Uncharacterized protein n=1 Tax=Diphasiastrum complanatum TaxID=34168 RepID=A0ACC2C5R0_DIPCM|nr:hypothetical protein O6H91_12G091900 [Diphasiastrum complanatum]
MWSTPTMQQTTHVSSRIADVKWRDALNSASSTVFHNGTLSEHYIRRKIQQNHVGTNALTSSDLCTLANFLQVRKQALHLASNSLFGCTSGNIHNVPANGEYLTQRQKKKKKNNEGIYST